MKRFIDWDKIIDVIIKWALLGLIIICFFSSILPEIPPKAIWFFIGICSYWYLVWKKNGRNSW